MARLQRVIERMPRARIVTASDAYLHVEFSSRVFRFVDDVEFFLEVDAHRFHFRSASRSGYSDFGVNRQRMEQIRQEFMTDAEIE